MNLGFPALLYFKKAAELQHLTHAAEELHIAQPSLSRIIHSMEKELGVPLFQRNGRNIRLTPYGQIVFNYSTIILNDLKEMQKALQNAQTLQQHTVSLAYNTASLIVIPFLRQFQKDRPDIRVNVMQLYSPGTHLTAQPDAPAPHLVLDTSAVPIENESTLTIFREPLVLAMRSDHPYAHRPFANLEDFRHANFISLPDGFAMRDIIATYCKERGFTLRTIAYSENPAIVADFILAGLGVTIVPQYCWHMLHSPEISFLPISKNGFYRYITLRSTVLPPPKIRVSALRKIQMQVPKNPIFTFIFCETILFSISAISSIHRRACRKAAETWVFPHVFLFCPKISRFLIHA